MTANELITGALRLLGAVAASETPTADELADGLRALNGLLDHWSAERLMAPVVVRQTAPVTPNVQIVTIGPGGTVNLSFTPVWLDGFGLVLNQTPPAEIPLARLTDEQWRAVVAKTITSTIPTAVHVVEQTPLWQAELWPVPTGSGLQLVVYVPQPLGKIANGDTQLTLPPGYERMLRANLALELAPEFGAVPSRELVRMASESLAAVKRANQTPETLATDPMLLGRGGRPFDWRIGV